MRRIDQKTRLWTLSQVALVLVLFGSSAEASTVFLPAQAQTQSPTSHAEKAFTDLIAKHASQPWKGEIIVSVEGSTAAGLLDITFVPGVIYADYQSSAEWMWWSGNGWGRRDGLLLNAEVRDPLTELDVRCLDNEMPWDKYVPWSPLSLGGASPGAFLTALSRNCSTVSCAFRVKSGQAELFATLKPNAVFSSSLYGGVESLGEPQLIEISIRDEKLDQINLKWSSARVQWKFLEKEPKKAGHGKLKDGISLEELLAYSRGEVNSGVVGRIVCPHLQFTKQHPGGHSRTEYVKSAYEEYDDWYQAAGGYLAAARGQPLFYSPPASGNEPPPKTVVDSCTHYVASQMHESNCVGPTQWGEWEAAKELGRIWRTRLQPNERGDNEDYARNVARPLAALEFWARLMESCPSGAAAVRDLAKTSEPLALGVLLRGLSSWKVVPQDIGIEKLLLDAVFSEEQQARHFACYCIVAMGPKAGQYLVEPLLKRIALMRWEPSHAYAEKDALALVDMIIEGNINAEGPEFRFELSENVANLLQRVVAVESLPRDGYVQPVGGERIKQLAMFLERTTARAGDSERVAPSGLGGSYVDGAGTELRVTEVDGGLGGLFVVDSEESKPRRVAIFDEWRRPDRAIVTRRVIMPSGRITSEGWTVRDLERVGRTNSVPEESVVSSVFTPHETEWRLWGSFLRRVDVIIEGYLLEKPPGLFSAWRSGGQTSKSETIQSVIIGLSDREFPGVLYLWSIANEGTVPWYLLEELKDDGSKRKREELYSGVGRHGCVKVLLKKDACEAVGAALMKRLIRMLVEGAEYGTFRVRKNDGQLTGGATVQCAIEEDAALGLRGKLVVGNPYGGEGYAVLEGVKVNCQMAQLELPFRYLWKYPESSVHAEISRGTFVLPFGSVLIPQLGAGGPIGLSGHILGADGKRMRDENNHDLNLAVVIKNDWYYGVFRDALKEDMGGVTERGNDENASPDETEEVRHKKVIDEVIALSEEAIHFGMIKKGSVVSKVVRVESLDGHRLDWVSADVKGVSGKEFGLADLFGVDIYPVPWHNAVEVKVTFTASDINGSFGGRLVVQARHPRCKMFELPISGVVR